MRHALLPRLCIAGFLLATPFLAGTDGCNVGEANVITRIEPDGRVYRAIAQVRDQSLPPEALAQPKKYPPSTLPADYPLKPEWAARWAESQPTLEAKDKDTAVSAANTFPSAAEIRRNYHLVDWPLEDRASTNKIEHTFTDFQLFGIDDWSEMIGETVLLHEYAETVDEMLRTILPAFEATLDEIYGHDYDLTELKAFLRDAGAAFGRRYAMLRYQLACENVGEDTSDRARRLKDILTPIGLDLPLNEKSQLDSDRTNESLRTFFQHLLQNRVRSKATGKHLTTEQARRLAKEMHLDFPPPESQPATTPAGDNLASVAAPAASQPTTQEASPWDNCTEVLGKHFERLNGKKLEAAALLWGARTGGANRSGPVQFFDPYTPGSRKFLFTLECAGPIIETNGQRTETNAVKWDFTSANLWPIGYRMHAVAIHWNRPAEKKLFGRSVLLDIDAVLKLKEMIGDRKPVKDALQQAIAQSSLEPLQKLAVGDSDEAKTAREILSLTTRPSP